MEGDPSPHSFAEVGGTPQGFEGPSSPVLKSPKSSSASPSALVDGWGVKLEKRSSEKEDSNPTAAELATVGRKSSPSLGSAWRGPQSASCSHRISTYSMK